MTTPDAPREITVLEIEKLLARTDKAWLCANLYTRAQMIVSTLSQAGGECEYPHGTRAVVNPEFLAEKFSPSESVSVEREREELCPGCEEPHECVCPDTPQSVPADDDLLEITSTEEEEDHTKALIRIALASDEKNARCLQAIAMKALDWHDTASPSVSVEREPYRKRFPDADEDAALEAERYPGAPDTPQSVPVDLLEITSTEEEEEAAIQAIDAPLSQAEGTGLEVSIPIVEWEQTLSHSYSLEEKVASLMAERDNLAVENDRLIAAEQQGYSHSLRVADSINASLSAINASLSAINASLSAKNAKLVERVSVLTEALEDISCSSCSPHEAWQIARAALTHTSEAERKLNEAKR